MPLNKTILIIRDFVFCLLVCTSNVQGQATKPADALISIHARRIPLAQVLSLVEKQTSYKFAYSSDLIKNQKVVTTDVQNMPLVKFLAVLFKDRSIGYTVVGTQIILQKSTVIKKVTISGYVKDSASGESLPGAVIYTPALKLGTSTNAYSFYSLTVPEADKLILTISNEGYETKSLEIDAHRNIVQNVNMVEQKIETQPGIVRNDSLRRESDSVSKMIMPLRFALIPNDTLTKKLIPIKDSLVDLHRYDWNKTLVFSDMVKTVSSLSGNGDIMNSIQMTPGVMAGLDASPGYFVRGGNADQNLVQLDEATLYNPSHFFGLVSILNASAINNGTLLKEGFPASYGDNLSSVLDISMKEGNNLQTGGELQAGTTVSGFTFNGPIVANKSSYLLSVRRSTLDLWTRPLLKGNTYNNYYFYDVNAKINYQVSQKDRIYLSLYQGRDNSSYSRDSTDKNTINYEVSFGNQAITLRWNHLFSQKIFSNISIVYNNYFQSISATQKPYYAQLYSGIRDVDLKTDLNYYPNPHHKISVGINYLYQTLMPASVSDSELATGSVITVNPSNIPEKYAYRLAAYLGDEIKIGRRFQMYVGARTPLFYNTDVRYVYIEPRFSLLYLTSPTSGLKLTYTQMHQFLHMVKSYNASFPAEIWIGSSQIVKPESSSQFTTGVYKNFSDNMFQSSLEVYYKEMGNLLMFKGGAQPTITSNIENTLIFGKGQAYGTELSLRKVKGKLTGWLAYTLSYASQKFDSLNLGNSFPFADDRRHCLYVTAAYAINRHWELSSNLVITSGRSFTLKSASLSFPGQGKGLYDNASSNGDANSQGKAPSAKKTVTLIEQNNYKLAPYNRLDISISYKKRKQVAHRWLETQWELSVYNVYARPNTFFAYRSIDPVTQLPVVQQVSFIPIIPSITYRLKF